MESILLLTVLIPLAAAVVVGLGGKWLGRAAAHTITIAGVAASFGLSAWVLWSLSTGAVAPVDTSLYTWAQVGDLRLEIGRALV